MNYRSIINRLSAWLCVALLAGCQKWEDKTPPPIDLTKRYCNVPVAINYNHNFPGIEDNSVCIFPSGPYVGEYAFVDSVFYPDVDTATLFPLVNFNVSSRNDTQVYVNNFCSGGQQLAFSTNRYYRAISDSVIAPGKQLMCRSLDTLSGTMEYRPADSSIYLEFTVVSDTGITTHRGRAYKK
ncbi:MAG TPA: hypothetical protein VL092_09270 [Chitinophagaceae bacterium]|nr:hypothetical protein [Chitinophagaceae bacterium]